MLSSQLHQAQLNEIAVSVCINGISHAVMMVSPGDLQDFALGFALSEGLIHSANEVLDIVVKEQVLGWQLDIQTLARTEHRLKQRRRTMAGPSGCGLCGITSIKAAMTLPPLNQDFPVLPANEIIMQAKNALPQIQQTYAGIKGNHSAVYFDLSAKVIAIREDVGRHSALDKLIGTLHNQSLFNRAGFALLTSRCSHDLVAKAARVRLPALVTLAQPTSLAVASARQTGLALFSFQQGQLKRFS